MPTDPNDPVNRRLSEITNVANADFGEKNFSSALRGYAHRLQTGAKTQGQLLETIGRADAANQIFKDGMDGLLDQASAGDKAAETAWREYRDNLPDRKRWRDRQR
jgi:hypothetical protein